MKEKKTSKCAIALEKTNCLGIKTVETTNRHLVTKIDTIATFPMVIWMTTPMTYESVTSNSTDICHNGDTKTSYICLVALMFIHT